MKRAGGRLIVIIFLGVEIFSSGVELFSGGVEKFSGEGGVEIFSAEVEFFFREGYVTSRELKMFPGGLRIFGEIDNFSSVGVEAFS